MDIETKVSIVKELAEEVVTESELRSLFETDAHPIAYDGFEPSGIAPIHFGLQRARNVKKMLECGVKFKLYLADYFAFINNKLDGDLDHIRTAGEYFIEVWKASGLDSSKVEIVWAKDLMENLDYWDKVLRVGKATTLERVKRAITVMGRKEGESVSAAQLMYPTMQVTDIFYMDVGICQMGMDQRKANMLAREVADKYKWRKPVAVHHSLLLGLQGIPPGVDVKGDSDTAIEYKMSKSNPSSAVYMHDSYDVIKKKVAGAYCPEKVVEGNPMFNWLRLVLLRDMKEHIAIERPAKFGGTFEAAGYKELVESYQAGKLHPMDLKNYVAERLEEQIKPVREHFEKNAHARELYEAVKSYRITK
ncbi:Tyrosine--tRNA ligase [uncultured archaeon]|nr:Tyrosine--tRNA ligase [uncultured archaeon]